MDTNKGALNKGSDARYDKDTGDSFHFITGQDMAVIVTGFTGGQGVKQLARRTGHSSRTVRRVIAAAGLDPYAPPPTRPTEAS